MKIFILPDIDKYRSKQGNAESRYFVSKHPEQNKIKSIVTIPVIIREENNEQLVCIVSIDSDVGGYFQNTIEGEKDIRIRSFPLIRALALLYQSKRLIEHIKQ